jgi:hypothetical protein
MLVASARLGGASLRILLPAGLICIAGANQLTRLSHTLM